MVSQFREFLNTSPRFEELRESLPYRAGGSRIRGAAARRSQAMANNLPTTEGEGFDDEMADEENDFEGLDGSEMVVDAHVPTQHAPAGTLGSTFAQANGIPAPTPVPTLGHPPAGSSSHAHPSTGPMGPLAFSSFMSNEPASGGPPLSAHGYAQAMGPLISDPGAPQQASSAPPRGSASGASTAPMQLSHSDTHND